MITKELENKISSISSDYIQNEATCSLLLLLLNCIEDMEENSFFNTHDIPKDIIDLKAEVKNQVAALKFSLDDNVVKASALEYAFEMRKKIISVYETVYRYYAQWNTISMSISDEIALRKYKETLPNDKKIDLSSFYSDCIDFLQSATSHSEQKNYMGQLFKCIPFKMARDKYYDLLYKSLDNAFANESSTAIALSLDAFKNTFAVETSPNYGIYFPEIASAMKDKKEIKAPSLSDDELDELYSDMNLIFESLTDIEDFCQETFSSIGSLIILYYLDFSLDDLSQKDFRHKDMYNKVCEMIANSNEAMFIETIKPLLEENIEYLLDKKNELNKSECKLLDKIKDMSSLSDDLNKILATDSFIRSIFYADINEEIFDFNINSNSAPADEEYRKKAITDFIEYVQEYFGSLPLVFKKSSMQMLLSSLPISMDIYGLMDYIKEGIDSSSNLEQQLLIIDKVGTTFDNNGFTSINNLSHHEHSDDCECGHNHHHHDDCECGHSHH